MKILLNIILMVVKMGASAKTAYDWRIKTVEHDSDFGDDLKVQTALNNERQQDILKNLAKTNNEGDYYHNSFYNPFNKNINDKSNYTLDVPESNYTADVMENGQHFLNNKMNTKYEEKPIQSNFDQNNNFTRTKSFKTDSPSDYGSGNNKDDDDYDFKEDRQNKFITKHIGKSNNNHHRPLHKDDHEDFFKNLLAYKYNGLDDQDGDKNSKDQDEKNTQKTTNMHSCTGTSDKSGDNVKQCPGTNDKTGDNVKECSGTSDKSGDNVKECSGTNDKTGDNVKECSGTKDKTGDIGKECSGTKDKTEDIAKENIEVKEKGKEKENLSDNEKKLNENEESANVNHHCGDNSKLEMDSFVGTNLFDCTKKCFSIEDVALLVTRKDFESLIPKDLPQNLLDDETVALLMKYFYVCHETLMRTTTAGYTNLAQKVFYDTLGGYLNFYLVPVTKYSFYAGQICLRSAQQVLMLHQESKRILNTNGNGWKLPPHNVLVELKSAHIEPLTIPQSKEKRDNEPSFCMHLDMNSDENHQSNDNMIVQLPKLETENTNGFLGNIMLPFKRKQIFDLKSERSAYILVKFYETVTKCYRFENINQDSYNDQFKTWLLENINVHLSDDQFYPGLGAVLRIYEYLRKGSNKNKDTIGISKDVRMIENEKHLHNKKRTNELTYDEIKEMQADPKKIIDEVLSVLKQPKPIKIQLPKVFVDPKTHAISVGDNKTEAAVPSISTNSKPIFRNFDYTPSQIAIVAVPAVVILLIIIVCCSKCCRRKKPMATGPKHSSSSSSNLFNSPVRFFYVKKKADYSSNDAGKKNNKSVKIDKKKMVNSDSSASSSPVRNKKSKNGKGKDSGKK